MTGDPPLYGAYQRPPAGRPSSRTWLIPVLLLAVVIVVAVAGLATFLFLRGQEGPGVDGPAVLRRPVRFLAVQASEPRPCKPGLLPDPSAGECLKTGSGMTISRVAEIRVQPPDPANGRTGYSVAISFIQQDAQTFARMTTTAAQAAPPANRIAILAEGRLLSAPAVTSPITGGSVEISGPSNVFTKDYTEGLVRRITGR